VSIDGDVSPKIFREFIEALGATAVDFDGAEDCCGSYQMVSNPDAAVETASGIIASAQARETDALILSCPLCEYNLGRRQEAIIGKHGELKPLPIFYFTQLLALALGVDAGKCLFDLNHQPAKDFLEAKGIAAVV
jgi:heterodisulfide reductase subunit B